MSEPLIERLVVAVIDALEDGDPRITIGLADDEVRIHWHKGETCLTD